MGRERFGIEEDRGRKSGFRGQVWGGMRRGQVWGGMSRRQVWGGMNLVSDRSSSVLRKLRG